MTSKGSYTKYLLIVLLTILFYPRNAFSQYALASHIHSHNDYAQLNPFFNAWQQQAGSIEADVFLMKGSLYVAHTIEEIERDKTLEDMYLQPLSRTLEQQGGYVYADHSRQLNLMIDLKTEGVETLNRLLDELKKYPLIKTSKSVQITISGNVPDPGLWFTYPDYIHFDGRPYTDYSAKQLKHVSIISDDLKRYTLWNGSGQISESDRQKLKTVIDGVHDKGKRVRFWGAPDHTDAWTILMSLGVDYISTDRVTDLSVFLRKKSQALSKVDTTFIKK